MDARYILSGNPVALARARMAGRRVFDSQKQQKIVSSMELRHQHLNKPFFTGPLFVEIIFFIEIPASLSIKKRNDRHLQKHFFKSDIDNLIKYIFDVSSGIIYQDDCLISEVHAQKFWSLSPRTEFYIKELK